MKELEINNPFVVGKYLSDKYFCDRSEETGTLSEASLKRSKLFDKETYARNFLMPWKIDINWIDYVKW